MTPQTFTLIFLLTLGLTTFLRLWLRQRQVRHVAAHRHAVPPAFAGSIELAAHQKAADYTLAKARLGNLELALATTWILVLTLGGGLQALSTLIATHVAGELWQGLALFAALAVIGFIYDLPLDLFRTFGLEARFGFNRTTLKTYLGDMFKQALLAAIIGLPLLWLVLWLMSASGELWWAWTWGVWLGVNLIGMLIYPIFIAPLFNKFTPLEDADLKTRVEALLARCGFQAKGLFVMDGSRRSAHGNAYFTGFGRGRRIVFFDTLLNSLTPDEIEAVLAHELGHFKHKHLWKRLSFIAPASLLVLALLGMLIKQSWFFEGLGVASMGNAQALILFSLVLPLFLFPLAPISSFFSRKHEFEADRYAARHARADDLVQALVKLYRDNASTLTPDPLHSQFYDSHPPAAIRIAHLQAQRA